MQCFHASGHMFSFVYTSASLPCPALLNCPALLYSMVQQHENLQQQLSTSQEQLRITQEMLKATKQVQCLAAPGYSPFLCQHKCGACLKLLLVSPTVVSLFWRPHSVSHSCLISVLTRTPVHSCLQGCSSRYIMASSCSFDIVHADYFSACLLK